MDSRRSLGFADASRVQPNRRRLRQDGGLLGIYRVRWFHRVHQRAGLRVPSAPAWGARHKSRRIFSPTKPRIHHGWYRKTRNGRRGYSLARASWTLLSRPVFLSTRLTRFFTLCSERASSSAMERFVRP